MLADKGRPIRLGDPLGLGESRLVPGRMPDSGVRAWVLDCPPMFTRDGGPYLGPDGNDWPDNFKRFALLARAAALVGIGGSMMGWQPDVIHANDWQTGLVPVYLDQWGSPVPPCVYTIHNIEYQGIFGPEVMGHVGLDHQHFSLEGIEFHGWVSYMKAGLVYARRLTTVSPTYAREVQTPA
ncbi:MAG: glycogen/starch synthase, partial [Planctomycetaceae bacterium]|nr:glycogen/starch synthase [Planctomycetaceae bacterium]